MACNRSLSILPGWPILELASTVMHLGHVTLARGSCNQSSNDLSHPLPAAELSRLLAKLRSTASLTATESTPCETAPVTAPQFYP